MYMYFEMVLSAHILKNKGFGASEKSQGSSGTLYNPRVFRGSKTCS
jgi:hypothetical protein